MDEIENEQGMYTTIIAMHLLNPANKMEHIYIYTHIYMVSLFNR